MNVFGVCGCVLRVLVGMMKLIVLLVGCNVMIVCGYVCW